MCVKKCPECNKSKIYLGTSLDRLDYYHDIGCFDGAVFTDCIYEAQHSSYKMEVSGRVGITIYCDKVKLKDSIKDESTSSSSAFYTDMSVNPSIFKAI